MSEELFTLDASKLKPHITSTKLAMVNRANYGEEDYVIHGSGRNFDAEIINNNTIRIYDGVIVQEGIRGGVELNGYRDASIDNGTQSMRRNDIIVVRWKVDSSDPRITGQYIEVQKGTPTSDSTAVDPAINSGKIHLGATVHDTAMYRVKLNGLNIVAVERMFTILPSISELSASVDQMLLKVYPIGSIYISMSPTAPGTLFGGTWVAIGQGRVLIGAGSNGTTNYTAGSTGGAESRSHVHTVNSHTHDMTHNHTVNAHNHTYGIKHGEYYGLTNVFQLKKSDGSYAGGTRDGSLNGTVPEMLSGGTKGVTMDAYKVETQTSSTAPGTNNGTKTTTGAAAPGTNSVTIDVRQPYLATYMWKRTA